MYLTKIKRIYFWMKHNDVKLYLKDNLDFPSLDFEWTDEDNKQFFNFIHKNASQDFLHKKENLLYIREEFAYYFQPVGYILFKINATQIRLKVFPYTVEAQKSQNITAVINIINANQDSILKAYHGKSDQIYIKGKLRNKICDYTQAIDNERVNHKELVRFSVRKALELKDEDLIMLKHDCIFIKLCDVTKKRSLTKSQENTVANRYNGISEDEMIAFNREHFASQSHKLTKNFFLLTAKLFIKKYFLNSTITNQDYEKKVFPYIQLIITKQLIDKFDNCEDFFKGFAGYLFRIHFEDVFRNIAEIMLEEVAASNDNMIEFLKYYSLNVIIINNQKYQVPNLTTEDGRKWNVVTILSIVRVYIKAKLSMKKLQTAIDDKESQIMSMSINGLSPVEHSKKIDLELKEIVDLLIRNEHILEKYYDSLQLSKSEEQKETLKMEISLIKAQMQELREEKKVLANKSIKRIQINKFIALEQDVDTLNRTFEKDKKILEQNRVSFESIKGALTKALISKKHLV